MLAVRDEHAVIARHLMNKQDVRVEFKLSLQQAACIEIVVARLDRAPAKLGLDEDYHPTGTYLFEGIYDTGPVASDNVMVVYLAIYTIIHQRKAPTKLSDKQLQDLDDTLRVRRRRGRSYYIAVLVSEINSPLRNRDICQQLFNTLKHLNAVFIDVNSKDDVLLTTEQYLIVLIREFLPQFEEEQ